MEDSDLCVCMWGSSSLLVGDGCGGVYVEEGWFGHFILRGAVGIRGGALGWGHCELWCVNGVPSLLGEKDCGIWQGGFGLGR